MRFLSIVAGVAAGTACAVGVAAADPARLLAPDDPSYRSGWRPPASPTGGLKAYRPVGARNWLDLGKGGKGAAGESPGMGGPAGMRSMPGMNHPGGAMKGMPGMEGG